MLTINNRDELPWRAGMTVRDVLNDMGYTYALITVTVDGELVEEDDYERHAVPDGAQLTIFHLTHGG